MEDASKSGAVLDLGYTGEGTTIAKIGTENRIINKKVQPSAKGRLDI
jgi:hypothetical protein